MAISSTTVYERPTEKNLKTTFKKEEQCKIYEPNKCISCNNIIFKECLAIPAAAFAASFGQPETSWFDDPVTPFSAASGYQLLLPFPLALHLLVPQMRRLVQESKKISLPPIWVHREFDELLRCCYCSKSQKSKIKTKMLKENLKAKKLKNITFILNLAAGNSWSFWFLEHFYCIYSEFSVKNQRMNRGFLYFPTTTNYYFLKSMWCTACDS